MIADPHLPPESPVQSDLPVEDDSGFYAQDYPPTYSFRVHERVLGGLGLRWWRGGYCLIHSELVNQSTFSVEEKKRGKKKGGDGKVCNE